MPDINISQLIEDLKSDEGTVLHEYKDSRGYSTIGSGILIDARGGGITDAENEILLENRIHNVVRDLDIQIPWLITKSDNIQRQICNMSFNMGVPGVLKFKDMLGYIKNGDFDKAADEALNSQWSIQVPNRAKRISDNIRKG